MKDTNPHTISYLSAPHFVLPTIPARQLSLSSEMIEEDLEVAIKVVVVGNGAVGKSSMIQRYCKGVYTQEYKKTIGVDFLEREIE